jgi:hypothetical protein
MGSMGRIYGYDLWVGSISNAYFGGEEGTGGSELAAGVGVGGGQPGRSAMVRGSLVVVHPYEF